MMPSMGFGEDTSPNYGRLFFYEIGRQDIMGGHLIVSFIPYIYKLFK